MSLTQGTRLGPYEITGTIGAGGMGEVYRARDTRLNRDVAIKVLPDLFARDHDRLARFEREAQVLASLNHPHIAQIHGLEESDHVRALVMEYVDGVTLAELIAGPAAAQPALLRSSNRSSGGLAWQAAGPGSPRIPIDDALSIARQLAEALEAAHERGIIHRDLKPANIKIRSDDTVKVLDFGLAKALDSGSGSSAEVLNTPTITSASTQMGVILGTAAYMPPEQAKGKPVDRRADIWAFGCVLYEMLTGRPAFDGDTVTDVVAAIITRDPDWSALPPSVPERVRNLLGRCLEKDPRRRLRDIGDARVELENTPAVDASYAAAPPVVLPLAAHGGSYRVWVRFAIFGLVIAVAGVAFGRLALRPSTAPPMPVRFEIGVAGWAWTSVAPDGSRIAISSRGLLRVRDLDRLELRDLPGTEGAVTPFWSHDSATIAYGAKGRLWRMSAGGGAPVPICSLPDGAWDADAGGAWMPDDTIVFTNGASALMRVPAVGGDPVIVVQPDAASELHFHNATALPDGRGVLFVTHRKVGSDSIELWDGSSRRVLLRLEGQALAYPVYSPSGHLVFHRRPTNPGLWAVKFSLDRLEAEGQPFLVVAGAAQPSISRNSHLVYTPDPGSPPGRLTLLDRQGRVTARVHEDFRPMDPFPALSPDGTRAVVAERHDEGWDLWAYEVATGNRTKLTAEGSARRPSWGPDGRTVFYTSVTSGKPPMIKQVAADGSGRQEEIGEGRDGVVSRDGRFIFYSSSGDLYYRALAGDRKPVPFETGPASEAFPQPSSDGRYVLFTLVNAAEVRSIVKPFPSGDARWQVTAVAGTLPRWSRDGKQVLFASGDDIYEVDITTQPGFSVGLPRKLFTRPSFGPDGSAVGFDVSFDRQSFLIVDADPAFLGQRSIAVVMNFKP
jgi:Tol biopolymer transport system component